MKNIFSSGNTVFLLQESGKLLAKGDNKQGQLGVGDNVSKNDWTMVKIPSFVKLFCCSSTHSCAFIEKYDLVSDLANAFKLN